MQAEVRGGVLDPLPDNKARTNKKWPTIQQHQLCLKPTFHMCQTFMKAYSNAAFKKTHNF